jgi:hypothetical protein
MRTLVALCVLLCLSAACSYEGPAIRLIIDSPVSIPHDMSALTITVRASNSENRVCEPLVSILNLEDAGVLPATVLIKRGSLYDNNVAFHVRGYLDGSLTTSGVAASHPWPSEGVTEVEVVLEESCFGLACANDEHCLLGACRTPMSLSPEFMGDVVYDEGVSCLRSFNVEE